MKGLELIKTPTPQKKRAIRIGKLATIGDCRRELAKLFRSGRREEIPAATAAKLGYLIDLIGKLITNRELEERIAQLEAKANDLKP